MVWLAEAIGISAFHPRDMLRDREGGRRFSFFNRTTKRNSYVFCKEVTQVAVKTMKGWISKFISTCMYYIRLLLAFQKLHANNSFVVSKSETYISWYKNRSILNLHPNDRRITDENRRVTVAYIRATDDQQTSNRRVTDDYWRTADE